MKTTTNPKKGLKRMTIEVPVDLHRQYKQMAVARETTIREMVMEAMRKQVSRQKIG